MWTVSAGSTSGVSTSNINSALAVTQAAANIWGRYFNFTSGGVIDINIDFSSLSGSTLATGGTSFNSIGGGLIQAITILEIQDGVDRNGSSSDINITIDSDRINSGGFYFGLEDDPNVPFNQIDLLSVLIHEIGHGLGFISFSSGNSVYDSLISSSEFIGSAAMAAFGGAVPLASSLSHVSSSLSGFVMTPSTSSGNREYLQETEIRILQDIGLPIWVPTPGADNLYGFNSSENIALLDGDDFYEAIAGDDSVQGGAGSDTILGGTGNDILKGNTGNDLLEGEKGNDRLEGGPGSDTLIGGAGADTLNGGDGVDAVDYGASPNGVTINLATSSQNGGHASGDVLTSIENVFGTVTADRLTGNSSANYLAGGSGADTLNGGAGNDRLWGGDGNDQLTGSTGADLLNGQAGNDTLNGGGGADTLNGGSGFDWASYANSSARVEVALWSGIGAKGAAAGDRLSGIEALAGSAFNDKLTGSTIANIIDGGGAGDKIFGGNGDDTLIGGRGNDTIKGQNDDDILNGGKGKDVLDGGAGFDMASFVNANGGVQVELWSGLGKIGEAKGDTLSDIEGLIGSDFNDKLTGDGSGNMLDGGAGHDRLWASGGNDTLDGGTGNDLLKGQAGNDIMNGGRGNDTLDGAAGDDKFQFDFGDDADRFLNFTAGASTDDKIELTGFGAAFDTFAEVIAAATQSGADTVIDFGGGDVITLENVSLASLHADDFLFG